MSNTIIHVFRVIAAVVTLLVAIATLGLSIFAITIPHWGLFVVCLLLSVVFGFFSFIDYKYLVKQKEDSKNE